MAADHVLSITDKALTKILDIRSQEADGDQLALEVGITGVSGGQFTYDLAMILVKEIPPDDHTEDHGVLNVVIPADSVENLKGATLDVSRDLLTPSLVLDNPNVAVEEGTAYLRLGGGCQGCGMASVTLSQGIAQTIKEAIPEITNIIDVTDHASGENPYYEAAKA